MSKVQILRSMVKQRLTAAAEEICALFERTIAEYEEELCRSTEQNQRLRNLLDSALTPQLRSHRADGQQLLFGQKKVSPEQQEWSSSLDQQDPEPPHIKDEQEELWTNQEEADITEFTFTLVPVKHEDDDEEKPQSSQLHQRQTEQMETEADGQDCGGPEPARNSFPERHLQSGTENMTGDFPEPQAEDCPEPEAEDSPEPQAEDSPEPQAEDSPEPQAEVNYDVWSETKELQSSLNFQKNIEVPVSGVGCCTGKEQFTSSDCGERSSKISKLRIYTRIHTGEKPFSCEECGQRFSTQQNLISHTRIHTGEKPYSCGECGKRFSQQQSLNRHTRIHTGEKPYSCLECGKRFIQKQNLIRHTKIHTGEKPYSCGECGKRFTRQQHVIQHIRIHMDEKTFPCSDCNNNYN
ncbi:zinc finger protein GLI4-like [Sparus aurata]|uniref:Zinc finger protein GLI4-like n=1 Tax=Sparus aurata TaxID=8175 RepID=A0A671U3U7_SPAAU|nr:zinc finger protein GLI4-like [Sparus aurata]